MVEGVIEGCNESKRGEICLPQRAKHERGAEAHEDDADILNAVPGEQALEIVLHQRIERHTVDACLNHDARHQGRNVAGRYGVSFRKPDVKGHNARFYAEAEKEKQKNHALFERWHTRSQKVET